MKRRTIITEIAIYLVFFIAIPVFSFSSCRIEKKPSQHDYQLDIDNEGATLIDNGRIVGRMDYGRNPQLDSLIDKDNQ